MTGETWTGRRVETFLIAFTRWFVIAVGMRARPNMPESYKRTPIPGICRWCGKHIIENGVPNHRKTWHAECVHEFRIVTEPAYAARAVYERDGGVCQICKLNVGELDRTRRDVNERLARPKRHDETDETWRADVAGAQNEFEKLRFQMLTLGFKERHLRESGLYEVDHVRCLWRSGGSLEFFRLDNMQLLCWPDHHEKTKVDLDERRAYMRTQVSCEQARKMRGQKPRINIWG